ncbi:protein of unknown function [Cyclobacterium lianum]|uniref:Peptidase n=1 Tax=Cyclobacterium lianum TaxID=388280 RepID=A0A1M7QIK9_9BACT|nr:zinc-dependent metalloprotease [Cyclobacterium lianum]SHN30864.1 protein of unknown function [Cyclobacterium lianum]
MDLLKLRLILVCKLLFFAHGIDLMGQDTSSTSDGDSSIATLTRGMEKMEGFIDLYWDEAGGKIWMAIPETENEALYYPSLAAGLGSNDIGLDRGRISGAKIVSFIPVGNKLLLQANNYLYRVSSSNPSEQAAVDESFATSILWGFKIAGRGNQKILVDATDFFLQDALGVVETIKRNGQGNYKVDLSRSALYLPRTKSFPKNTEIEATITFTGDQAGPYIRQILPEPKAISLRLHHSFVSLPEPGFEMRSFDPRAGVNGISYYDYSTPISEPIEKQVIRRHRLVKKNPGTAPSEVENPIVYYIDPGTPEPIRTALTEGTRWWAEAFEKAGFINAFQVKLLPEDADPMDVRYHLVQWVHRSTRGWSYGGGVTDPRTGEIIKGKVTLGSLRVRQDYLIAQALAGNFDAENPDDQAIMDLALARMRQLAAHEVGHTLGLPHNYIASAKGRTSVMDYPHPSVRIKDGAIDLSDAYAEGIGEWDIAAIKMAYSTLPEGMEEQAALNQWIAEYKENGLDFLSDQDARPAGSAHPETHLWDNGSDPVTELKETLAIRKLVLNDFGAHKIPDGTPLAKLEELLVPVYMYHRYQVEAAAKLLGGVNYGYAIKGDKTTIHQTISREEQEKALSQILEILQAENLALPTQILNQLPPRPFGYNPNPRETFHRTTGLVFDPLSPAEIAAHHCLSLIFHPERASRLISQKAMDPRQIGLDEMIDLVLEATWMAPAQSGYAAEIKRSVEKLVLQHLMQLGSNSGTAAQVRAVALMKASALNDWIKSQDTADFSQKAHYMYCMDQINHFKENPDKEMMLLQPLPAPDGAPIGQMEENWISPICGTEHY